jgi:SlyX protein
MLHHETPVSPFGFIGQARRPDRKIGLTCGPGLRPFPMGDERLIHLEARYAWLERHVLQQDKAMAEMGEELRQLRREISALRQRDRPRAGEGAAGEQEPPEPPPPHY